MQGDEVRSIRTVLGLSQAAFAQLVGVAKDSVARWERGELGIRESAARLMLRLLEDAQCEQSGTRVPGRGAARGEHAVERGGNPADGKPGRAPAGRALLPTTRAANAGDLQVERHRHADRRYSLRGGPGEKSSGARRRKRTS